MTESWADTVGRPVAPKPAAKKTVRVIPNHFCQHEDGHTCPWLDDTDLRLGRCGCWTETPDDVRGK